jgi:hypothetical protein
VFDLGLSGTFGTLSFFYICILVLKAQMRERIFCGDFVLLVSFAGLFGLVSVMMLPGSL